MPGTAAWPIQTPDDRAFFDAYELGAGKNGIGCLTGTWQQVGAWRIMTATGDDAGAIVELNGFYWPIQSAYVQPLQNVLEQAPGGGVRTITFINDGRGDRFLISLANGGCTMLHRNQYHEISESGEAIEVVHYLDQALLKAATRFLDDAPGVQVFWIEANTSETEWKVRYREVEENRWTEGVDPFQLRRRSDGAIVLASESAVFDTDPGDCPIDLRLREVLAADG